MNEFKPHDYFKADDQGYISRKVFIEHVRNSYDHMRELASLIKGYDQTIDTYLERWDQNLESLDDSIIGLLKEWIDDSTFATIINEEIFKTKADQVDLENVTAQLQQKATKGDIGLVDLNKNKVQFDETWFADSVKQQWTGNTPVNATPAERSITTNKLADKSVTPEITDFIESSTNLFDKDKAHIGYVGSSSTGELVAEPEWFTTDFIRSKDNQQYTYLKFDRILCFGKDYNFIGARTAGATLTPATRSTLPDTFYIRMSAKINGINEAQVNIGDALLPYRPFYHKLKDIEVADKSITEEKLSQKIIDKLNETTIVKPVSPIYFAPETIVGDFIANDSVYGNMTLTDLYAGYDDLIARYPSYISKKVLGKDQSGQFDVLEINLKPEEMGNSGVLKKRPKIMITAVIHGHEQIAGVSLYRMVKNMVDNWEDNPLLEYMRFNVEFVFIPVLNPWGYVNDQYKNVRGVNLQRNFPIGWENGELNDVDSNLYGGTAPSSEVETQYAIQMFNQNNDAMYYVDYHARGLDSLGMLWWILPSNSPRIDDIRIANKYHMEKLSRLFPKEYSQFPKNEGVIGDVSHQPTNLGAPWDYTINELEMPSSVYEGFKQLLGDGTRFTSDCYKANLESFTNWIITVLKQFKESN